ncbi:MAG: hypothetical protein R3330_16775, partial [Saprospiraceae bacterium]|nr:hypothetical protein [Saprospiraceae bacterium]
MIKLPETYHASSRIWIYQTDRVLSQSEIESLKQDMGKFAVVWTSHNRALKAYGDVLHGRFLVLMVDESQAGASGCSIDKSVHFMQSMEEKYGLSLFDRRQFAYWDDNEVKSVSIDELKGLYDAGEITGDTLVFDNLVKTKEEMENSWLKPLESSWHK